MIGGRNSAAGPEALKEIEAILQRLDALYTGVELPPEQAEALMRGRLELEFAAAALRIAIERSSDSP